MNATFARARDLAYELSGLITEVRRHRPAPPSTGLVLEVGGGQSPSARADVVVDKYPFDDFERPGERGMSFVKPLVVADGHALPFADQSFAYVIAQHVLEHATDPVRFAGELARVAAAGFVQVPSRESELVYGWPFHPWLIDLSDGRLVFEPRGDANAPAGQFMHEEFAASALVRLGWLARRSRWHHSVPWRGELPVRVLGASRAEQTASFDLDEVVRNLRRTEVPPTPQPVREVLRCPVCRSGLRDGADTLTCTGCGRTFPVVGGTPVLVSG